MKTLYHAFLRPRHEVDSRTGRVVRRRPDENDRRNGLEVLKLILHYGLLCAPERFRLFPDPQTERPLKRQLFTSNSPHAQITQSRVCFTLMDHFELAQAYQVSRTDLTLHSHSDLFGEFAIGFDPLSVREFGVLPTVYFYRHQHADRTSESAIISGLGSQIVHRLDEIRVVFAILSQIEALAKSHRVSVPDIAMLESVGIDFDYEDAVRELLSKLTPKQATRIFQFFATDRVAAWSIADFVKMLLSLYQTVDSTLEDAPLAFFNEREWRLIHHMREGLAWFSLGAHPKHVDPGQIRYASEKRALRAYIEKRRTFKDRDHEQWFFQNAWVLWGTESRHIRNWIREIVVPSSYREPVETLVRQFDFDNHPPQITVGCPRWTIRSDSGFPVVELLTQ